MNPNKLEDKIGAGVLGAGNFARMVLLPAILKDGRFRPRIIASAGGLSATHSGEKLGFEIAATDEDEVFKDPDVKSVFIITRHDLHAGQVLKALKAGKHVFTEKPLALTVEDLAAIEDGLMGDRGGVGRGAWGVGRDLPANSDTPNAIRHTPNDPSCGVGNGEQVPNHSTTQPPNHTPLLMVGFNRRFSPAALAVKDHFSGVSSPLTISVRFNAGEIPPEHWTQDLEEGGGRIIGEACHAIDLATYLAGSPPVRVFAESVGGPNAPKITDDQVFITLRHANGSISSIAYLAGGDKSFPKERVELFGGGRVAVIDDFKSVTLVAGGKTKTKKGWSQDKGHRAEIKAFADVLANGGPAPIPWADLRAVSLAAILAVRCLRDGFPQEIPGGQST